MTVISKKIESYLKHLIRIYLVFDFMLQNLDVSDFCSKIGQSDKLTFCRNLL